jgi:hypothetical protein
VCVLHVPPTSQYPDIFSKDLLTSVFIEFHSVSTFFSVAEECETSFIWVVCMALGDAPIQAHAHHEHACLPPGSHLCKKNFGLINQSSNSLSVLLQAKCIAVLKWSEKVVHSPSLLNDHCPPTFVYCLTTPHLDRRQIIHCEIHAKLSFVVPFGSISCDLRTNTG